MTDNNRRARFYAITKLGQRALGEETESWKRRAAAMDIMLRATEGIAFMSRLLDFAPASRI